MPDKENNLIVKYHNDLGNTNAIGKFTPIEMDIFFAILSKMRDREDGVAQFTFSEIRKMSGAETYGTRFLNDLKRLNMKYLSLAVTLENENEFVGFHLFSEFRIVNGPGEKGHVDIKLSPDHKYILDDLTKNFTRFELMEFTSIRSAYGKSLYRALKQFRSTGKAVFSIEKFREYFNIPESYKMKEITRRVIKPSVEEISPHFEDLSVEYEREKKTGNPVKTIIFTFKPQTQREDDSGIQQRWGIGRRPSLVCPECGRPLIEKVINGSNCWCHEDGFKKNALCDKIYNSVAEVKGYRETPARSEEIEIEDDSLGATLDSVISNMSIISTSEDEPEELSEKQMRELLGL